MGALIRYDAACLALAEAKSVDEARDIRDKSEAVRCYARQAKNKQLEVDAAEIRLRAERRLGEILAERPRNEGGRPIKTSSQLEPVLATPTLRELGIDKKLSSRAQKLAAVPAEEFEEQIADWRGRVSAENERVTTNLIRRGERARQEELERAQVRPIVSATCRIIHAAVADLPNHLDAASVDIIITDPPYPKDFLAVYSDLANTAHHVLKDGGSLVCMVGQSYLPEIIAQLSTRLKYHWTVAYLTPGGQSAQLWTRKVNSFWKPLLWFTKGEYNGEWIGDVAKSAVNDNDKEHHHWGQSESGMADIVERFTKPGDVILDPFLGGGTTGLVALDMGRNFIGSDSDADCIQTSAKRIGHAVV